MSTFALGLLFVGTALGNADFDVAADDSDSCVGDDCKDTPALLQSKVTTGKMESQGSMQTSMLEAGQDGMPEVNVISAEELYDLPTHLEATTRSHSGGQALETRSFMDDGQGHTTLDEAVQPKEHRLSNHYDAAPTPAPRPLSNKGWRATQSSTDPCWGWSICDPVASRAIDGNLATSWSSNSCSRTERQAQPWWEVDLGSRKSISAVIVTNRGDCCGSRLSGFNVHIDGRECAVNVAIAQGQRKHVPCSGTGQVVRVQVPRTDYLTICEFEVLEAR